MVTFPGNDIFADLGECSPMFKVAMAGPTAATTARRTLTAIAARATIAAGTNLRCIVSRAAAATGAEATGSTASARAARAAIARFDRVAGDRQGGCNSDAAERATAAAAPPPPVPAATAGPPT